MKVERRRCVQSHTVTAQNGESFTVEAGRDYLTSEAKEGIVTVFGTRWVLVPVAIFQVVQVVIGESPSEAPDGRQLPDRLAAMSGYLNGYDRETEADQRHAYMVGFADAVRAARGEAQTTAPSFLARFGIAVPAASLSDQIVDAVNREDWHAATMLLIAKVDALYRAR